MQSDDCKARITCCASATEEYGREIGCQLQANSILALRGNLGAGKTTLIKGIVQGATGIMPDSVNSPTFTYLNIYSGKNQTLYHFDLYRLRTLDDFLSLGFDEFFTAGGICCIEWSERIRPLLPKGTLEIELEMISEQERSIICNL